MVRIALRFPAGVYRAQSVDDFAAPEWPPHPVRLIAALVAAANRRPHGDSAAATAVLDRLAGAPAPQIVADRLATLEQSDGEGLLAPLRGASRWAPRNHSRNELSAGLSPRDLGRGRAEVFKVGVAVGDRPVAFEWPDLDLEPDALSELVRLAEDVTVVGTSASPVIVSVTDDAPGDRVPRWTPTRTEARRADDRIVRVATANLRETLDGWHDRRALATTRTGEPAVAPYVPPPTLGVPLPYRHTTDAANDAPRLLDPQWWGDVVVLAVDREASEAAPRAVAAYAFGRATRSALLSTFADVGEEGEAPAVLRGRGSEPHAAFVALSFVDAERADGRTLGLALILPHVARLADVPHQRLAVERGLLRLVTDPGIVVAVPGVGGVRLRVPPPGRQPPATLREAPLRGPSATWSTVTPIVHSRWQARKGARGLLEQLTAECRDVGLPAPARVSVRREPRFRGAPALVRRQGLPEGWEGLLRGPHAHLDLEFDQPIAGPVLLGRARHFGLGLCRPYDPRPEAQ